MSLCARVALVAAFHINEVTNRELNYHTITNSRRRDYTWNSKEAREAVAVLLRLASEPTGQENPFRFSRSKAMVFEKRSKPWPKDSRPFE
jgi:hypothetical protein